MFRSRRSRWLMPLGALALATLLGGCYAYPAYPGYGYYGGYYGGPYYGGGAVVAYGGGWGWHDGGWHHY
jgi:hypothetical protein